jgi:hypothetical protein
MTAKLRKYHYTARSERKGGVSSRIIKGESITKALDRALELYKETWSSYQDTITLTYTGTYSYN